MLAAILQFYATSCVDLWGVCVPLESDAFGLGGVSGIRRHRLVWSAPNYCYRCGNVASILSFNENMEREVKFFTETEENNQMRGPRRYEVLMSEDLFASLPCTISMLTYPLKIRDSLKRIRKSQSLLAVPKEARDPKDDQIVQSFRELLLLKGHLPGKHSVITTHFYAVTWYNGIVESTVHLQSCGVDLADAVIESLPYVGAMAVSNLEA
ncbi:hypothetical protein TEA_001253 [Camellia sinensis var. sinensis]|uniref:Serine/threonine specific protein phosphatases domain-containing protein n=1 Tax=Camellia sinensis var. sinensis TaxID=542762 RepID=A0A4S4F1L5_CAMSN|nr:hypothetical protein TEA_001253 [Camellia sinensis var. sinensis]